MNLGSKKKKRKALYFARQKKKAAEKEKQCKYVDAISSDNIESAAEAMGISLK
jgi:hypothetical protein